MASAAWEDIALLCNDGIELCGRRYSNPDESSPSKSSHRVLCWHGWLDNCQSFYHTAPALVDKLGADVVALNFPGHGTSSHKSMDGPSMLLMEYCYYIHEALRQLKWENETVTLVGHSMGAAVSLMYSAAFPVKGLVLLDSLGPYPKPATDVSKSLERHIKARSKGKPSSSIYPGMDVAIETRCLTAKAFPGNQYISKEAAKELVEGATKRLEDGRLEFQHDQRLKWTSILFLSKEHVTQIYQDVASSSTRTCLLIAKDGMPFDDNSLSISRSFLKPEVFKTLPGSHHFHMDPDTADGVANEIVNFLSS